MEGVVWLRSVSLAHGDVITVTFDNSDNGTLTFYKNGVSQGQAFSGISGTYAFFVGSFGGGYRKHQLSILGNVHLCTPHQQVTSHSARRICRTQRF